MRDFDLYMSEIEGSLDELRIYDNTVGNALVAILRVFEDYARLSIYKGLTSEQGISQELLELSHHLARSGMDALNHLLPRVLDQCPVSAKFAISSAKENIYEKARDALNAAFKFSLVQSTLLLAHGGVYGVRKVGKYVLFTPRGNSMAHEGIAQTISFAKGNQSPNVQAENSLVLKIVTWLNNHSLDGLCVIKRGVMELELPDAIWKEIDVLINDSTGITWTLNDDISLGEYSVRDAKRVWGVLVGICAFQTAACIFSKKPGIGLDYLPIAMNLDYIIELCARRTGVDRNRVAFVIRDLIYRDRDIGNEIMFQPLIKVPGQHIILISPHLITFSRAERNFMKLWSRLYPAHYGKEISAVGNLAEHRLAEAFRAYDSKFTVIESRNIRDQNGRPITDIDLTVYDPSDCHVLFGQIKWFLAPDDTKEVWDSDGKLNHGMHQLDLITNFLLTCGDAWQRIFNKRITPPQSHELVVISSSSVGSFWVRNDHQVMNAEILLSVLQETSKGLSLKKILTIAINKHKLEPGHDFESVYQTASILGTTFLIPATHFHVSKWKLIRIIRRLTQRIRLLGYYPFWSRVEADFPS